MPRGLPARVQVAKDQGPGALLIVAGDITTAVAEYPDNVDPHKQISKAPAPFCIVAAIARAHRDRDDAIVTAYGTGAYSYRAIAEHFQFHLATVGQIIRARLLQCEN